jgi:glycosyltransferase involved in cell wall biosynthesis
MLQILYISSLSTKRLINEIKDKTGEDPGYAVQKFNRFIALGLKHNGVNVKIYSNPPVNKIARRGWVSLSSESEGGLIYNYVKFLNIPLLKDLCVFWSTFLTVLKFGLLSKREKAVVCDVLAISMNLGAVLAAKLTGIRIVGVVTDMPGLMVNLSSSKGRISLQSRIISIINHSYLRSYTHYVFLTEQMNDVINKYSRPYIVMEALCDNTLNSETNCSSKVMPRMVMYAGGLHEKYGLKMLVEGFRRVKRDNIKLVLYGSGPYVDELLQVVKDDARLEYRGIAPNEDVMREQLKATLLVNPRPTSEKFTQYSFPSKNMEYMVSGTPLLTTKLPGMPKDYYPYVYLFEDESVEGYARTLDKILSLPPEELYDKGVNAKQFVLKNKNYVIQTKRILNLIEKK